MTCQALAIIQMACTAFIWIALVPLWILNARIRRSNVRNIQSNTLNMESNRHVTDLLIEWTKVAQGLTNERRAELATRAQAHRGQA